MTTLVREGRHEEAARLHVGDGIRWDQNAKCIVATSMVNTSDAGRILWDEDNKFFSEYLRSRGDFDAFIHLLAALCGFSTNPLQLIGGPAFVFSGESCQLVDLETTQPCVVEDGIILRWFEQTSMVQVGRMTEGSFTPFAIRGKETVSAEFLRYEVNVQCFAICVAAALGLPKPRMIRAEDGTIFMF